MIFTGCTSVTTVKDATVDAAKSTVNYTARLIPFMDYPDSEMVRKIAVLSFENETVFEQLSLEKVFQDTVTEYISESCPQIHLVLPDSPEFPESLKLPSRQLFGNSDNLAWVRAGRQSGLNAILTGKIVNLSLSKKDEGILWFRETREQLRIQFYIGVMDMETGAKIFDDMFVHDIKDIAPEEIQAYKEGRPSIFASVGKNIEKLGNNMAQAMCEAVLSQPWTGFVASVRNERVYLPFGKISGIKKNTLLDAYDAGEIIENYAGQRFILPGKKIAEIKITHVEKDFSMGEIISGENVQPGYPVKTAR